MSHSDRVIASPNVRGQLAELGIIGSHEDDAPEQLIDAVRFKFEQARKLEEENPRWGYYPSARVVIEWPIFEVGDGREFQDEEWVLEMALDEIDDHYVVISSITKDFRLKVPPMGHEGF